MAGLLDAVKGAITGGANAITGIASGVSAMLSSDKKSNVVYVNFGMAGSAGQQQIAGRGSFPVNPSKSTYTGNSNNTEKLLTDVVKYLVSINGTLKKQIDFDKKVYQENALASREAQIEQNSAFEDLGRRFGAANDNEKPKSGIISAVLSTLASLSRLGLKLLFTGLAKAISGFATAWAWLRGLSFLKNIKSLIGLARALPIAPIAAALAATGAIVLGTDYFMKETAKDPLKSRGELETKYGMKPVLDKSGRFTEGYILPDGKQYSADSLPSKYKDILNAYGPAAGRDATSESARKRIKENPSAYNPDTMAKELGGGSKVGGSTASATHPTSSTGGSAYDVVLGYGKFGKPEDYYNGRKLSQLTVAEALDFGKNVLLKNSGNLNSSAMGAYQITYSTLQDLVKAGVVSELELFNAETQDRAAKALYDQRNKKGTLNKTWAHYMNTGQGSSSMTFEEAKPIIMAAEGTSGKTNTAAFTGGSGGLMQEAGEAINSTLTNIAEFIGTIGGKIVGPGVSRSLTTTGPDFAKLISDESNKIQNEIALGQKKKETKISNISSSAQSLRLASPTGSISVIDPNYAGGGIEKYLGHFKLAG